MAKIQSQKLFTQERNCYSVMIDYMDITSNILTIHFLNGKTTVVNYVKRRPREHFERKEKEWLKLFCNCTTFVCC